jgi:YggT family protein
MRILGNIYWFVSSAVLVGIVAIILLIVLRMIVNKADLNPFAWTSLTMRRLTDPFIGPVRRGLMGFGVDPKYAPLITILLTILFGWFSLQLVTGIANTLAGILTSLSRQAGIPIVGYVLYGLLSLYSLLIFIRIIFSYGRTSYANRAMRFLLNVTEPLLAPLRRMLAASSVMRSSPMMGRLDFSPIVAFIIIWVLQVAVARTLLKGWPIVFFG